METNKLFLNFTFFWEKETSGRNFGVGLGVENDLSGTTKLF